MEVGGTSHLGAGYHARVKILGSEQKDQCETKVGKRAEPQV